MAKHPPSTHAARARSILRPHAKHLRAADSGLYENHDYTGLYATTTATSSARYYYYNEASGFYCTEELPALNTTYCFGALGIATTQQPTF